MSLSLKTKRGVFSKLRTIATRNSDYVIPDGLGADSNMNDLRAEVVRATEKYPPLLGVESIKTLPVMPWTNIPAPLLASMERNRDFHEDYDELNPVHVARMEARNNVVVRPPVVLDLTKRKVNKYLRLNDNITFVLFWKEAKKMRLCMNVKAGFRLPGVVRREINILEMMREKVGEMAESLGTGDYDELERATILRDGVIISADDITKADYEVRTKVANMDATEARDMLMLAYTEGENLNSEYKGECCIDGILEHFLNKPYFKNLTRSSIYDWFEQNLKKSPEELRKGITAVELCKWFEFHKVSLYCFDALGNFIDEAGCIKSRGMPMSVRVKDNHCYVVDSSKIITAKRDGLKIKEARLNKNDYNTAVCYEIDGEIDNIYQKMLDIDSSKKAILTITNVYDVINGTVKRGIYRSGGLTKLIVMIYEKTKKVVEVVCSKDGCVSAILYDNTWVVFDGNFKMYKEAEAELLKTKEFEKDINIKYAGLPLSHIFTCIYTKMFNELPKSCLSLYTRSKFMANRITAINAVWKDILKMNNISIDKTKHYTSVLINRLFDYAIYSIRDEFKRVKITSKEQIKVGAYTLNRDFKLFQGNYTIHKGTALDAEFLYGLVELGLGLECIDFYIKPSYKLNKNRFQDVVKYIYGLNMDEQIKKTTVNEYIGGLAKSKQTRCSSVLTTCYDTAERAERGDYSIEFLNTTKKFVSIHDDEEDETDTDDLILITKTTKKDIYKTNFTIYDAIVQCGILEMAKLFKLVEKEDTVIYGLKTDCLYVGNADISKLVMKGSKVGLESIGMPRLVEWDMKVKKDAEFRDIVYLEPDRGYDELKVDNIDEFKYDFRSLVLTGKAGCRKTNVLKNLIIAELVKTGKKYLCTTTSNMARLRLIKRDSYDTTDVEAFTLASIFMDKNETKEQRTSRLLKNDVFIIDEYTMTSYSHLLKLYELWRESITRGKPLIVIMVGDLNQLKSVDTFYGSMEYTDMSFFKEMVGYSKITLTKSYRMNDELSRVAGLIEQSRIPRIFKENLECNMMNIAYRNDTRKRVNTKCAKFFTDKEFLRINTKEGYILLTKGTPVVSKENDPKLKIYNNMRMIVKGWTSKTVIFDDFEISYENFSRLFILGYCLTVHAVQGSTITEPITIFDVDSFTKELATVAFSRNTRLEDISVDGWTDTKDYFEIEKVERFNQWDTEDVDILCKNTGVVFKVMNGAEVVYTGSTLKDESLAEAVERLNYKQYKIVELETVRYDDESRLYRVLQTYMPVIVKEEKIKEVKEVRGSIYDEVKKSRWRFEYSVKGVLKNKTKVYTADTKQDMLKQLEEIQKKIYNIASEVKLNEPELLEFKGGFYINRYEWSDDLRTKQTKVKTVVAKRVKETLEECKARALKMM